MWRSKKKLMTEINNQNKLIADFMGYYMETINEGDEWTSYAWRDSSKSLLTWMIEIAPPFHSSWDWLMPVIEKINQYYFDNYEKEKGNQATLRQLHGAIWIDLRRIDIKETHADVVQFITWYNTQSK